MQALYQQFPFKERRLINLTGIFFYERTFGKVLRYFSLGGDETCCIASDGHVDAVGVKYKIKVPLITPFFACSYRLPQNWLLVPNPFFSSSKLQQNGKLWTNQGCPFQRTGLALQEQIQGQQDFFLLEINAILPKLMTN